MRLSSVVINQLFQFLARLEVGNALGGDINRISGFRIATSTSAPFTHAEAAKSTEFDLLTLVQCFNDALEDDLN